MNDGFHSVAQAIRQSTGPGVLAQLLVAAHSVQKGTLDVLARDAGYERLSVTYAGYMLLFATREYSPGQLADALHISKQACSKVIRELESQGLIERRPHPQDSRSCLLSLAPDGLRLMREGSRAADAVLADIVAAIGAGPVRELTELLETLIAALDVPIPELPPQERRPTRLNALLMVLARHFTVQLGATLRSRGFGDIGASSGHVLGLINHEALHIQYIASVLGISKQAVASSVADLEKRGYVTRLPDPEDGRQVLLVPTDKGKALLTAGMAAEREAEAGLRKVLGADGYRRLEAHIGAWYLHVADQYDTTGVLQARIRTLSQQLLAELGPAGARALAHQLVNLSREQQA